MAKKESKYRKMRQDAVNRGREQTQRPKGGGALNIGEKKFWKPKKGINLIDIIPYEIKTNGHPSGFDKGDLFQQMPYRLHFGVGPDDKTVLCPTSLSVKGRCPLCERRAELIKQSGADEDEIDSLKYKERMAFNIIDLDNEDEGVQVFDMSPHLFANTLYEEITDGNGDFDDAFQLENGSTLKVKFREKKLGKNTFLEATSITFEDRKPYGDDIVDDTVSLDECLNVMTYEEIEALWLGLSPDDVGGSREESQEERPEKSDRGRSSGRGEPEPEQRSRSRSRDSEPEPEPEPEPESRSRNRSREKDPEPEQRSRSRSRDNDPEPEPEQRSSNRTRSRDKEPEPEPEGNEANPCPFGNSYPDDCERHTDCDVCDEWEKCRAALKDAKKPSGSGRK